MRNEEPNLVKREERRVKSFGLLSLGRHLVLNKGSDLNDNALALSLGVSKRGLTSMINALALSLGV